MIRVEVAINLWSEDSSGAPVRLLFSTDDRWAADPLTAGINPSTGTTIRLSTLLPCARLPEAKGPNFSQTSGSLGACLSLHETFGLGFSQSVYR